MSKIKVAPLYSGASVEKGKVASLRVTLNDLLARAEKLFETHEKRVAILKLQEAGLWFEYHADKV